METTIIGLYRVKGTDWQLPSFDWTLGYTGTMENESYCLRFRGLGCSVKGAGV